MQHRNTFIAFIGRGLGEKSSQELPLRTASGKEVYIHLAGGCKLRDPRNVCIVVTDISARESAEESLDMKSRTLEEVNTALRVLLKQREGDKSELEENILSNVKELILPYVEKLKRSRLDAARDDRAEASFSILPGVLKENIVSNMKELILPYVEKLKESGLTAEQMSTMDIIESNLKEITSPLISKMQTLGPHRRGNCGRLPYKGRQDDETDC